MFTKLALRPFRAAGVARAFAAKAADAAPVAAAAVASKKDKYGVDPENPEIAPSLIPWKQYKNEYYEKRGYTVAGKDWKEWSELPEGPFKYLGVKVNPDHVLNHGPVWKFFSDWRTGVPASILLSMPLWMFSILPPIDERTELGLITISAGWVALSTIGPMFRSWKRTRVYAKVKALLQHESELNAEIADAVEAYKAGSNVVSYAKTVNAAERALRGLEAEAATRRLQTAQRDALLHQLDYLVALQAGGAADTEAAVVKAARSAVEGSLEKDAALQQRSIDAALKALKDGTLAPADDIVAPLFDKAADAARAEFAAKPAAKPFSRPEQVEIFRKRFGVTEDAATPAAIADARKDAGAWAVLVGRVGGEANVKAGAPFTLKPAIAYAK